MRGAQSPFILHRSNSRNPSLYELLTHRFARTKEPILDSTERQPRDLRYLVVAHVVRMAQQDQLSVGGWKSANHMLYLFAALCSFALLFWRKPAALNGQLALCSFKLRDQ